MLKRIVALGLMTVGLSAAPALAEYPPADDSIDVDVMAPCPGDPVTVTAQTFEAGGTVTATLASDGTVLGTSTADAEGRATLEVTIPDAQAPGSYDLVATGAQSTGEEVSLTAAIEVQDCDEAPTTTAEPAEPTGDLPRTGSSDTTMTMVKAGVGLAAAGGLLLALARRRQRNAGLNSA